MAGNEQAQTENSGTSKGLVDPPHNHRLSAISYAAFNSFPFVPISYIKGNRVSFL